MATIYRPRADRLSVAEAKRLISEALPAEPAIEVWEASDGRTELREVQDCGFSRARLDSTFAGACASRDIVPRHRYEPTRTDYSGPGLQDAVYTITHDELVRLADMYGLTVEIDAAPVDAPAAELVQAVVAAGDAPLPLTTGDIAFCFDGLRYTEAKWKKPLGDKPKWLDACVAIPGRRGIHERRWNPVLIGGALVSRGHVQVRSVRAKFQTQPMLKPWLEAWKDYEADNFESA